MLHLLFRLLFLSASNRACGLNMSTGFGGRERKSWWPGCSTGQLRRQPNTLEHLPTWEDRVRFATQWRNMGKGDCSEHPPVLWELIHFPKLLISLLMAKASHAHVGCLSQKRLILLQPFIGLFSDKAQSEVSVKGSSNSWSQPCHYPFPSLHSTLQFWSFLASSLRQSR